MEAEADRELLIKYVYAKLTEAPALAKQYTEIKGEPLRYRKEYYRLQKGVEDYLQGKKENRFLLLPGLRGVGKTTLLLQTYRYLREKHGIEQDRLLYFSTDELKTFLAAGIWNVIDTFVTEIHETTLTALDKELYILVDEAHYDKTWSQTGKIVYDKTREIFLIITGSSALSLEMNVDAARRAKKEMVFPLGFSEYIALKHDIHPPKGMAESLKNLILQGPEDWLSTASKNEAELRKRLLAIERPIEKEFESYLASKGFPFGLHLSERDTHQRLFDMITRVVEKDVYSIQSFNTETKNTIMRVLTFLALQKPGGTSDVKLAQRLKTSPSMIRSILDVLEKTHLIFSIKPYGPAGKIVRKPWKYYFLSPSINAAIRSRLGVYDRKGRETLGVLAENHVASYLHRMKETTGNPAGIFYDPEKEGVDFLLQTGEGGIVPIEVSVGRKKEGSVKRSMSRYRSKHGIIVSKTEKITARDNVIRLPITTFSWM